VLAAGGSYTTPGVICTAAHGTRAHTSGAIALLGLTPAAKRRRWPVCRAPKSTVLRHDCSASSDREELPTHGLLGTTGTDAIDRNISEASKPAVISQCARFGNTERDCRSPSGEVADANGSQTWPSTDYPSRTIDSDRATRYVQWRCRFPKYPEWRQ
jgi:hypothetical protein